MIVRIATRGSALALAQARYVASRLLACHPGLEIQEMIIKTRGDLRLDIPLAVAGAALDKGLFTREIELALLENRADLAVHSLKDLPTQGPEGLILAAFPEREDPRDILITREPGGLAALPSGTLVATSSPRRVAQLLAHRTDLRAEPIRGNVPTRLVKIATEKNWGATILAAAGLKRLGLFQESAELVTGVEGLPANGLHAEILPTSIMLPAPGQAAIAIQCREADQRILDLAAALDHSPTRTAVTVERALLQALGGGCHMALGTLATLDAATVSLHAALSREPHAGEQNPLQRAAATRPAARQSDLIADCAAMLA